MADKVELRLTKSTGQPWGFRLQGGKDFNMPIVIQKVNGGSPAEQAGLRAGDHVLCVADRDAGQLRHKQVQDLIISSGNCVTMTVIRGGMSPVRPPSLQPNNTPQHTPVPRARNPFSPVKTCTTDGAKKAIVHNQHNSPMPLYSDEKIAETLSAQAEVLTGGAMGVDFRKNEKKFDSQMSDVLRMVREMDEFPEQFRESESEFCENQSPEAAPHSGGSHTRSGHSIVVRPDSSQKEQFSVQQSVNSPIPQANAPFNMGPIKKKGPPVPQKPAKVPGMRSTSATVIRKDPESGGVKLVSVVDTETNHYNAFNRSPQTFKETESTASTPVADPTQGSAPVPREVSAPVPVTAPRPITAATPGFVPANVQSPGPERASNDSVLTPRVLSPVKSSQSPSTPFRQPTPDPEPSAPVGGVSDLSVQDFSRAQSEHQRPVSSSSQHNHFAEQFQKAVTVGAGSVQQQNTQKQQSSEREFAGGPEQQKAPEDLHGNSEPFFEHRFPTELSFDHQNSSQFPGTAEHHSEQRHFGQELEEQERFERGFTFQQQQQTEKYSKSEINQGFNHQQQQTREFSRSELNRGFNQQLQQTGEYSRSELNHGFNQQQPQTGEFSRSELNHGFNQQQPQTGEYSRSELNHGFNQQQPQFNSSELNHGFNQEEQQTRECSRSELYHGFNQQQQQVERCNRSEVNHEFNQQQEQLGNGHHQENYYNSGLTSQQPHSFRQQEQAPPEYPTQHPFQQEVQNKPGNLLSASLRNENDQGHCGNFSDFQDSGLKNTNSFSESSYAQNCQQQHQRSLSDHHSTSSTMSADNSACQISKRVITESQQSFRKEMSMQRQTTMHRQVMSDSTAAQFQPAAVSAGQSSAAGRAPQLSPHAPMQEAMQTFPGQTQLSQVDYTSYVPQKKGGTSLMWPPPKTEECSIQQQSEGSSQPQLQQNVFDSKFSHQNPHMTPSQLPNTPLAQMSTISSMSTNKQMSFSSNNITSSTVSPGQPMNLPSMSAPGGGIRGLGAGGTAAPAPGPRNPTGPAAVPASGLGDAGAPPGSTGKSAVAGKNNGPKRGRGQRKAAGSMSRIPMCSACGNQIRGPFIAALGQCWCPGCFVCSTSQCRQNLENIGFVEVEEKIHCENCWESYLAPTCSKCRKRIKEDCLKACGTSYHPECFACAYCGGLFGNSAFFMEDGLPYCENDWNELFTTKCVGCGFPIEAGDRWVEALNKNFHAQCFKCAICGSNLEGQSFLSKQGRPFCKHHARM